jgi:hypothetical protein
MVVYTAVQTVCLLQLLPINHTNFAALVTRSYAAAAATAMFSHG